ncbi:GNAT family N-acetyltransferase [Lactobacillus corticis]|uniref:GNAT family acetyltransferase n=1 Tax=Lactobacillus corticis TaxID=2201249 RepID=A0A916QGY7_9LACO|nr:GNAT family N-acetyltransferase [Lactobacillus corticis]GFZ27161.1 GNAT family acetyltransferase [Lactobacillus corticis]
MIRQAEKQDFPFVFPILEQIFDEMDMASIKKLPQSQFYDLMRQGFISERYRYSYRRTWVEVSDEGEIRGMLTMYPYEDQVAIDEALKTRYAKVGLPFETVIFDDQEAWPDEWYLDSLAVHPDHWGQHVASRLMDFGEKMAKEKGYQKVSLNVDLENPRAIRLYEHKGYQTEKQMTIGDRTYNHMVLQL